MTIEEKAKRYDEAIERAKHYQKVNGSAVIPAIFPELKESEDERVRKALIEYFNEQCDMSDWNGVYGYQVVAWLEKQGQVKDSANFQLENKMCKENGDSLTNEDEMVRKELLAVVGDLVLPDDQQSRFVIWLEKQGKISPILSNSSNIVKNWNEEDEKRVKNILSVLDAQVCWDGATLKKMNPYQKEIDWLKSLSLQDRSALEAANEPADNTNKVVAKFHKGEWITNGYLCCQISDVLDDRYIVNTKFEKRSAITFKLENDWRLWTINDAKDGDVLQLGNVTAIFKKFIGNKKCYCYCSVWDGKFEIPTQSDSYGCYIATPAINEQRDLLEKAMTDAGYTFDFEKKELKEITTPKSEAGDKIEPRFKVGDWVVANYSRKISQVVAVSEDGYGYQLSDGLCFGVSWCDIFHLWDIKNDANDGDVLASDCSVFIFQKEYIAGKPTAYCGIVEGNFCQGSGGCWTNEQCHPATKEQWDTLRSKMREAGYEWDSEKKELKEITASESEADDDEEDDKEADDKAENWKLTLVRRRLENEARTWKTPKVRKYE